MVRHDEPDRAAGRLATSARCARRPSRNGDGTYAITGQKIYISWGDNDFTDNVCHLVLARLPDGAPGTKGISLFLVPKFIPDADGTPGRRNALRVVSLEHKLGLHGSPTAVMQYDGATGWLVGEEHGGMARDVHDDEQRPARRRRAGHRRGRRRPTQQALAYALDRKQGRSRRGRHDRRPCRRAPDAGHDEGRDLRRPRHRAGLRRRHRHGAAPPATPTGAPAPRC